MKKLLLVLLLLVFVAYLAWRWLRGAESLDHGRALFYDRVWIDHVPSGETDPVQVLAVITEEPIGLFQNASLWRGQFELFRHEPRGDGKIVFLFPQTRDREPASYRAWKCGERGFDFCLDIGGTTRGTKRYFSKKGWELGAARTPAALVDSVGHLLAAPSPTSAAPAATAP